ncbi:hypothetical protein [uncultured Clostridium sp.]|uniref:hypothetical protein n=1 Tax=uncultured Clostridium sp. TaxID=59620 RepID=UPI0025FADC66|nr:hypothetical protein [uncultured Clostridium sp.]
MCKCGNINREYKLKKEIKAINPDGDELIIKKDIKNFCEEHSLDSSAIYKVCKGRNNHHRGWKFTYIE